MILRVKKNFKQKKKKKTTGYHRKNVRFVSVVPFLNVFFWLKKSITEMNFWV